MNILNKKMEAALEELNDIINTVDYYSVSKIANTVFCEIEGCILRNKGTQIGSFNIERILRAYNDRTGYEASYNEVRINDYVEDFKHGPIEGLALALRVMADWKNQLKKCFPNYTLHIVVVYDGEFTTLRVYKFREEDGSWIAIDNLDGYNSEAVMVMVIAQE